MVTFNKAVSGLLVVSIALFGANASPVERKSLVQSQRTEGGDTVFKLGNLTYLAHVQRPKASFGCKSTGSSGKLIPVTVIRSPSSVVTGSFIESTLANYTAGDDVFSEDFLEGLYISSETTGATLDASAVRYLESIQISYLFLDSSISKAPSSSIDKVVVFATGSQNFPSGPYVVEIGSNAVVISTVSRLYEDIYRDFLFGVYATDSGEDDYTGLGVFNPYSWYPYIP